jgi:ribosome-associated protein
MESPLESLEIARRAAQVIEDRLGKDIVIKDLSDLTIVCDYFVITSAPTRVQTRDICRAVEEELSKSGLENKRIQGYREGSWILMDYGTVVVHIFLQSERDFYDLEGLWRQAPRVSLDSPASVS